MKYGFEDPRLWWYLGGLLLYTLVRTQATYWIGRGMGLGFNSSRLGRRIGRERMERLENAIHARGPVVLFVAPWITFVRFGIWAAAGVTRLAFPRFALFSTLGAVFYSAVLGLGGYALLVAWLRLFDRSPAAALALLAAVAGLAALGVRRRLRRRGGPERPVPAGRA